MDKSKRYYRKLANIKITKIDSEPFKIPHESEHTKPNIENASKTYPSIMKMLQPTYYSILKMPQRTYR